ALSYWSIPVSSSHIYTLSLHDALPILTFSSFASENTAETKAGEQPFAGIAFGKGDGDNVYARLTDEPFVVAVRRGLLGQISADPDRKSTRLNSSHQIISYAVFCLKKKK